MLKGPDDAAADAPPLEVRILALARALDCQRIYPSGDRLVIEAENVPECDVRRVRSDLVATGQLKIRTPRPEGLGPEPEPNYDIDDDELPPALVKAASHADRERVINIALYRIVEGKGSVYESLATVMGISPNAAKCRVNHARYAYPSADLDPNAGKFSEADRRYFLKYTKPGESKAVRDWAAGVVAPRRARPDVRGRGDKPARRTA